MRPEVETLLLDIRNGGRNIQSFIEGRTLEDYRASRLLQAAVEREFEIIGEATNRLCRLDPAYQAKLTHARQIVDFRNLLAHGYAVVEDDRVYQTAKAHLPTPLEEVDALLAEDV
jgi:uncharacterized protein with HEPN domain